MKWWWIALLGFGCEGIGELGPKPTEKTLASIKKDPENGPYVDQYADSTQLKIEKKTLTRACEELQKKLSVLDTNKLPGLDKTAKDAITGVATNFPTACTPSDTDLDRDMKAFSDVARDAYYLGNDMRMRSTDGIDKVTGKVNPIADKFTKPFEEAADLYGAIGDHAFAQIKNYMMHAPLADREKAVDAAFLLIPRLSPDYGDQIKTKQLQAIMSAEDNPKLRVKIRSEIYGELPPSQ